MKPFRLILFFVFVTTFCCGQKATIEGLVFNKENNYPLSFVPIYSDDSLLKAETDLDGKFKIRHAKQGVYNFHVGDFPHFPDTVFKVEVPEKGKVNVSFSLQAIKITTVEKIDGKICPICHSEVDVIPIVYGMFDKLSMKKEIEAMRQRKIILGGCTIENQKWYCKKDHVEF